MFRVACLLLQWNEMHSFAGLNQLTVLLLRNYHKTLEDTSIQSNWIQFSFIQTYIIITRYLLKLSILTIYLSTSIILVVFPFYLSLLFFYPFPFFSSIIFFQLFYYVDRLKFYSNIFIIIFKAFFNICHM